MMDNCRHCRRGLVRRKRFSGNPIILRIKTRAEPRLVIPGEDPLAAYDASAREANAAFRAPGAMEAPCAVSYGPVPGEVYLGHRFIDVLIHGWDVAKATGQDTKLDPELVEACWAVIEPQKDLLLGSGMFGTDHEPEAGADRQTSLLELLGRTP